MSRSALGSGGASAGLAGANHGATSSSRVRAGMSLQYQISGTLDTSVDAALFVVDLFDVSDRQVAALKAQGRVVVAYVSVGSFEPWREDAASFPRAAIGNALADYPDEHWLDLRSNEVRSAIEARLDRARDKGFDGIYASTLGAYMQDSGFPLTAAQELDYARFVAAAAQARGLSSGLSGDFELGAEIASAFDWALATGCIARSYCGELASFTAQAKPVFDLETEGTRDAVCSAAASYGIPTTLKHSGYDAWRMPCS